MVHQGSVVAVRASRRATAVALVSAAVAAWWLVVGVAVVTMLPAAAASSTGVATAAADGPLMHVHLPGLASSPVPFPAFVGRAGYDAARQGFDLSDEDLIDATFANHDWVTVLHGQAVRIVRRDGEAVEVELVDGAFAGRRAWLSARQVAP